MNIYELIPTDRFITRKELMELTGRTDRAIRNLISDIRKEHCIISLSSGKGYRRVKRTDDMEQNEMKIEYELIKHQIAENNSRIKEIKKNMRTSIARLKILEKFIESEVN